MPHEQLRDAISAVLDSWESPRAEAFRKMNPSQKARGTAVTVQAMVFGNMGLGSGVAFTRNPWTGEDDMVVDFRFGVQGEDVVSGEHEADQGPRFNRLLSKVYKELLGMEEIEVNLKDMQDMEFTVQEGELFMLQTRNGKRSPLAGLKIAVALAEEGVITKKEALERTSLIESR